MGCGTSNVLNVAAEVKPPGTSSHTSYNERGLQQEKNGYHKYFIEPGLYLQEESQFSLLIKDDLFMSEDEDGFETEATYTKHKHREKGGYTNQKTTSNKGPLVNDKVRQALAKKYKSNDKFWNAYNLMHGNIHIETRDNAKIVRIFTSSTFTDTGVERNALMTYVYPKLKHFCKNRGYTFQVVDMRWGVRGEAEDDHMTADICLYELQECQRLSTGPNFVTFLSHKYGYQPIPRCIEVTEFEKIIQSLSDDQKALLLKWYRRDDNAIPAVRILQPISNVFPDYLSKDISVYKAAKNAWWGTFESLRRTLLQGVDENITDPKVMHRYHQAVTEDEIAHGILSQDKDKVARTCFWFKRNIVNIEEQAKREDNPDKKKKINMYYDGLKNPEAATLLPDLKNRKLPKVLPETSIMEQSITWNPEGVNVEVPEHRSYIDNLCQGFQTKMEELILQGIADRHKEEVADMLYSEVVQHVNFCRKKSAQFCGRDTALQQIRDYIKGSSNHPLIVYGDSGCGKTSLMAMAASLAYDWQDGKAAVIYRFLGTTRASSSLRALMYSIVEQLLRLYVGWRKVPNESLKDLLQDFKDLLKNVSADKPLVLLLDSLDQLDDMHNGRNLHWLPRNLPSNVKLILSCLPQQEHKVFDRLMGLYPDQKFYLELKAMKLSEVHNLLNLWLDMARRRLTTVQKEHLIAIFTLCPLPLFYKLSFDEALRWHSWDEAEAIKNRLQVTVADTIRALFERVEKSHGALLVTFALGCLTAAKAGLSEGEIEDMVSMNDTVLNDIYMFWEPPVRRLPPLLWVRVRTDLQEYLVTRGVDGVHVINWYHRQFWETAYTKYLCDQETFQKIHLAMAEYFHGIWSGKPKPYIDKEGKQKSALRGVAEEPLQYPTGAFNLRKLNQLPFHLTQAREIVQLKEQVLFNYDFILAKLKALGFSAVMEDLTLARQAFPEDEDIPLLKETLQLSQEALVSSPSELASQLVGRIHGTGSQAIIKEAEAILEAGSLPPEALETLNLLQSFQMLHDKKHTSIKLMVDKARESDSLVLLPHCGCLMPPGGQLLHKFVGHTDLVLDMDISGDGKTLVTGSLDYTAKLWTIETGELQNSIDFAKPVGHVRFCHKDCWLVVSCQGLVVFIVEVSSGTVLQEIKAESHAKDLTTSSIPVTICQNNTYGEVIIGLRNTLLEAWQLSSGKQLLSAENCLDDWSVYNQGVYLDFRHLVSHGDTFIYASYHGTEFYTGCLQDFSEEDPLCMVEVFDSYNFDKNKEDADFTPKNMDHISSLAITGDGKQLLLCNGKDVKLHLYELETGEKTGIIDFQGNARIRACWFPPGSSLLYFCNKNSVGMMDLTSKQAKSLLPHPCSVRKVVTSGAHHVITLAEDSVLRIWDQRMKAYQTNMVEFTGKVKVNSTAESKQAMASFAQMFQSITGKSANNINATDILTTDDLENYWTKDVKTDEFEELVSSKATTKFLEMQSPGYIAAVQEHPINHTALCFSVWETTHMTCVHRMFFPSDSVYVYMVYQDKSLLVAEKGKLKMVDLIRKKVWKTFQGELCIQHRPSMCYLHLNNELVTESRDGLHLTVYSISDTACRGLLETPADAHTHYQFTRSSKSRFMAIKESENNKCLAARVSSDRIILWNLQSLQLQQVINMRDSMYQLVPSAKSSYAFTLTPDGQHLIISRDNASIFRDAGDTTSKTSVIFINTNSGILEGHAAPYKKNQQHTLIIKQPVMLVRQFRKRYLQVVGVGTDKKFYTVAEQLCGNYTSMVKTSRTGRLVVTWCPFPHEKTIKYWSYEKNNLTLLASFTPDKQVTDVGMSDKGENLLINSDGGVIKLQLTGKTVPPSSLPNTAPVIFSVKELDAAYPINNESDEVADNDIGPDTRIKGSKEILYYS